MVAFSLQVMSIELPEKIQARKRDARITLVTSAYNLKYVQAMLEHCVNELATEYPFSEFEVLQVPGAFEIPLMVRRAIVEPASREVPEAVIALGVIIRGETAHADLVGENVARKLMDISCETLVPVINEVLLLNNEQQAFARCIASTLNRGKEAARAAIKMINLREEHEATNRRFSINNPVLPQANS